MTAERDWITQSFEEQRPHLRSVAYRMLGSFSEADDAVQEAWLRVSRSDTGNVENLRAWLTTIVARVSLNMLRSRKTRRESSLEDHLPDPVISPVAGGDPEQEALVSDSIGLALLVVLDTLSPAERLSFVLHDVFGVPFDEIAPIIERSPVAARQLASRARRRVRVAPAPDPDLDAQRAVVDAFLAASREGDFERLVNLLDPDIVLRVDGGTARPGLTQVIRGRETVGAQARRFARFAESATPVLVNGVAGAVAWTPKGEPFAVGSCTVRDGRIISMELLADPDRISKLDLTFLEGEGRP